MAENILEENIENKEIKPEQLPEGSAIQKEAEQLYDNDKRNDEVSNEVTNDFFENFVKNWKSTENVDKPQIDNSDEINYQALQDWANSVKDDPTIAERGIAYSLDDVKDKKDLDSYKWAQQNDYNAAQDKLKKASNLMKKAREGDEFNNEYRKAAGQLSFPAGAARARAQKNINVADTLQNAEMGDTTFSEALKDKQLIKDLKGMPIEQDRLDRIGMFINNYRAAAANKDEQKAEQLIEENPEIAAEALPEGTNAQEEATQIIDDDDARNDEVNNERLSEDFETVDDLYDFIDTDPYGMGWNNGRVDDVDLNSPDFPVDNNVYAKDDDFVGPDEVVDYGLDDQNQYSDGIDNLDETVAQENVPEVDENDFVKSDVLPSADNVLELKPEEQDAVTEAIEEAAPEEEKETYFGMLGIPHRQFGGSSHSSVNANNNEQYKLDHLNHAGAASLGRLGGFSTGSGSVSPGTVSTGISKPHNMTEHASSRAGGGNIPKSPNAAANSQVGSRTGNSNNGFVTSNGGNVSSGPVQKRSSLKSPKPTQLPNFTGHTAPAQTNQLGSAEDLHGALIERIKGMLDNLDAETRKKLGFSPTLYNYNGTPIDKLDGATLVQISEMLEDMQNG